MYGIDSLAQKEQLVADCGGACEICGVHYGFIGRDGLHIDHKHGTKEVRGLLCFSCNTGLGKFRDQVELLNKAAKYLSKPTEDAF